MFPKKLFFWILLFFLTSCQNEYWIFHDQQKNNIIQKEKTEVLREDFHIEQIEDRDIEIHITPDEKVLNKIVDLIEKAKIHVYVEVYILTEKTIIQALKNAKRRWIDVRIILEKNVFGATSINSKTFKALKESGIGITYDNSSLYNFVHTKLLLIDDIYIITTGNLSYASFIYNREFYVFGKNISDLAVLTWIFLADFSGKEINESTANLVISPINSRKKIETLLLSAKNEIFIYAETFSDPAIIDILSDKIMQKIPVIICMTDPKKISANTESIALLRSRGIDVRTSKKPVIHAKSALVDMKYNYIGSENFSANSLDNNREIGILLVINPEAIKLFKNSFESDCPKK